MKRENKRVDHLFLYKLQPKAACFPVRHDLFLFLSLSIYLTQKQSYEIYTIIYCVQAFSEIFQEIKMVKSMAFGAKLYSKSASSIF